MFRGQHLNDGQFVVVDFEQTSYLGDIAQGVALLLIPGNPNHPYSTHRWSEDQVRRTEARLFTGEYCEDLTTAIASYQSRLPSHLQGR
jgi:hypothetical protein